MESVGILGYGRFGKVLTDLLSDRYHVKVYDPNPSKEASVEFVSEDELLKEKFLFIAVPINQFEPLIKTIAPRLGSDTTVFDVCSIKLHPVEVMQKYLPESVGIIATHPLFGPDSIDAKKPLNLMIYPVRDQHNCYNQWKSYFNKKGFNVVEITPDEHDRFTAESQGVVHFVARFLKEADLQETPIDTMGFKQLLKLIENNCNDTWELFSDLQTYNPYSKGMIKRLEKALDAVKSKL